jgi:hypothetical protein
LKKGAEDILLEIGVMNQISYLVKMSYVDSFFSHGKVAGKKTHKTLQSAENLQNRE